MITTITFQEVKLSAAKTGNCTVCGKRRKRSRTFRQTISPFNKKKDGILKTKNDILKELQLEIAAWKQESINCCD